MTVRAVAAIAVILLLPVSPALADISPGELMYTDFFLWPNWRTILAEFDCTPELAFYFWNLPPIVEPVVEPPPIVDLPPIDVEPPPPVIVPPPVIIVPPVIVASIPEPATWAMMLLGFAGLIYAAARRRRHADMWT